MNPVKARNTLRVASQTLGRLPVTWWLSAGTVLGAYRDNLSNEFLEKDTDIDIGILGDDSEDMLIEVFENKMDFLELYKTHGHLTQLLFSHEGILLDFYFFIPEGDKAVNYNFAGKMVKPLRMVMPPTNLTIGDSVYPVPNPIEEYLELRFGKDWKTPKEHKVWIESVANLVSL